MKVLLLYEYPPQPAGLATQGDLLYRGLQEVGVDVHAVHLESPQEKEWYYRWFVPDAVVGVGYWGYAPNIIMHPLQYSMLPVPWLVADGYIAHYQQTLNSLPLILLTSNWVRQVYIRDGIRPENLEVLPVGCDTDVFIPCDQRDAKVAAIRELLGVAPDELMVLTVGGDGASKGSREVLEALAQIDAEVPRWKYVVKTWPQPRTDEQNRADWELATALGIQDKVVYATGRVSRNFMPYLLAACDVYAGPSRLEGFGMPHVEANACCKPVIAVNAMAFLDTMVHNETAFLASVAREIVISETVLSGEGVGDRAGEHIIFDPPRVADYRASVTDIAEGLKKLLCDPALRQCMGEAGRRRAIERFDYRVVARQFVDIVSRRIIAQKSGTATSQKVAV